MLRKTPAISHWSATLLPPVNYARPCRSFWPKMCTAEAVTFWKIVAVVCISGIISRSHKSFSQTTTSTPSAEESNISVFGDGQVPSSGYDRTVRQFVNVQTTICPNLTAVTSITLTSTSKISTTPSSYAATTTANCTTQSANTPALHQCSQTSFANYTSASLNRSSTIVNTPKTTAPSTTVRSAVTKQGDFASYVFVPFFSVVGLVGNIVIVLVNVSKDLRHLSVTYLMLALAFSDTIVCVLYPFQNGSYQRLIGVDIRAESIFGCHFFSWLFRSTRLVM